MLRQVILSVLTSCRRTARRLSTSPCRSAVSDESGHGRARSVARFPRQRPEDLHLTWHPAARCETCGAELRDASQRFCGGEKCHRVFMKHPKQGTRGSWLASQRASTGAPRRTFRRGG